MQNCQKANKIAKNTAFLRKTRQLSKTRKTRQLTKTRKTRLPCFRDFLLSLVISLTSLSCLFDSLVASNSAPLKYLLGYKFSQDHIEFNMDETGLQLTMRQGNVIAQKGSKRVPQLSSREKGETVSNKCKTATYDRNSDISFDYKINNNQALISLEKVTTFCWALALRSVCRLHFHPSFRCVMLH